MNRVALMHANGELADRLAEAVNQYCGGWRADAYAAVVDEESRTQKARRMRRVAGGGYDLIQADELVGNGPAAQLLGWATDTPVCGYLRGWGDYTNGHGQYGPVLTAKLRAKTAALTRTMDGMAAISHAVVGGMTDQYPMGDCEVVERPYDVEKYSSGHGGVFEKPTILTTTNLRYREKYDGVTTILDGLKPVFEAREGVQYAVAAGGRHLGRLQDYVRAYEYSDRVRVLGYRSDVPDLLASADIFAYVSFLDGAPSAVYEAQAAGLPVVGGDAAGVPEAVGDAGAVVPPTAEGVRRGVSALLDDAAYRERLEQASREKMQRHNERVAHDWTAYWEGCL